MSNSQSSTDSLAPVPVPPADTAPYSVPALSWPAAGPGPGAGGSAFAHALRRRWWLALGIGLLCAAAVGAAVWVIQPPEYTSKALLRIAAHEQQLVFDTAGQGARSNFDLYKNTQQQLVKSDFVLIAALRKPEIAGLAMVREQLDPVTWLAEELRVEFPGKGELMLVQLTGDNAREVAALVGAVVDAYMSEVVNVERNQRQERLNQLDRVYTEQEGEVRRKRTDLKQLAEKLGTGDAGALALKQQIALEQFNEHRKELVRITFARRHLEGELRSKQALLEKAGEIEVSPFELDRFARADATAAQLQSRLDYLQGMLAQVGQTVQAAQAARHVRPYQAQVASTQEQLAQRKEELRRELQNRTRAGLEAEVAQLQSQIAVSAEQQREFESELQQMQKLAGQVGGSSIDVEMMRAEIENLERVLNPIAEERERLKVELRSSPRITILQSAEPPQMADQTRRIQLTALAGMMGIALPVFGIVFWDVRGKRINSSEEVSEGIGLAVLGTLPVVPARAIRDSRSSSRKHQHWRALLDEAINSVIVRLLREARHEPLQLLMVSSAGSGEGKTTLASQMAMSLARSGRRTLLVDCDLRRPALDRVFQVPLEPGVSELLLGTREVDDVVHETSVPNLRLITAGGWLPQGLEVLTGGALRTLFARLREKYDFVVIDGSPILPVADARLIAQNVDGVILSVLRDVSQVPKLQAAWRILESLEVRSLGSVVTGSSEDVYHKDLGYAARTP